MTHQGRFHGSAVDRLASALESVRAAAEPRLGIDPRALAAFRIALGLLVLADLAVYRAPGMTTFYTDGGVLPRATLEAMYPTLASLSIHAISGSAWVQGLLFSTAGVAALCLLVGYRTRLATGVSVVLLASLHARNPLLVNGGDTILLTLLFLGLFLPLDARWAIRGRSLQEGEGEDEVNDNHRVYSLATATVLVHFAGIYAVNAVFKYQSSVWMAGDAVAQIFHLEEYVVSLGPYLATHTAVLTAVNWLWFVLLTVSIFLVVYTGRPRIALVIAFVATHLGMAATMRLGIFPFVMISGLILFLPPSVWERVESAYEDRVRTIGLPAALPRSLESIRAAADSGDGAGAGRAVIQTMRPRLRRVTRVATAVILVGFLLSVGSWHAVSVGVADGPQPDVDGELTESSWGFFAPNPPDASSWYVLEGTLESGETINAVDGGEVSFDRPPDAAATYPTTLWHRYGTDLRYADERSYEAAAASLCERSERDLETLTVYRVDQPVDADGPVGEPVAHERIEYDC